MMHGKFVMFNELFEKKGLTFDRLRRLVEASEHASYAEAAGGDSTLASSFSRDIKALEDFFECKLVRKEGRQISGLTSQGERLKHLVTEYFNALISLQDEFREPPELITIGAGETVLQWVICTRLEQLKAAFPASKLKLGNYSSAETIRRIEEGSLDVGIVDRKSLNEAGPVQAHFATFSLGEIEYALYLTESLLEQHRDLAERELLETLPLAGLEGLPPLASAHQIEQAIEGFRLNFAVILTSFPQVIQAVRSGALAGFLPTLAEEELQQHGITKVGNNHLESLKVEIVLIYNTRLSGVKPYLATVGGEVHQILTTTTA
jgi:DNA-binding transcriptional LysR family regulator